MVCNGDLVLLPPSEPRKGSGPKTGGETKTESEPKTTSEPKTESNTAPKLCFVII